MNTQLIQTVLGTLAAGIFMSSTFAMLFKVWKTHDVASYSREWVIFTNIGNLLYWLYVLMLPVGPIYVLHGFYTIAAFIMGIWYAMYREKDELPNDRKSRPVSRSKRTTNQLAIPDFK